jgi:transposase
VTKIICGVDVSSAALDACLRPGRITRRFPRTSEGIKALAAFCTAQGVALVAMEATGGYEKLPLDLLWAHGMPAAIVNPRAVRRFAESMGLIEKTDRLDAGVIAWFAETKRIAPQPPAGARQEQLRALVTRLRQLTELRTAQGNQRRLVTDATVRELFEGMLALIARQVRALETAIASLITEDPLWRELDKAFRTIKGVADRTIARVMAEMPEIGTVPGKAAAKLNGVAPLAHDSGSRTGRRPIRGGRSGLRSILFVVADVVRRHDPDFAAFHKRLSDAGKPKKVIRIALAHKLLVRLNAKARDVRRQRRCPA